MAKTSGWVKSSQADERYHGRSFFSIHLHRGTRVQSYSSSIINTLSDVYQDRQEVPEEIISGDLPFAVFSASQQDRPVPASKVLVQCPSASRTPSIVCENQCSPYESPFAIRQGFATSTPLKSVGDNCGKMLDNRQNQCRFWAGEDQNPYQSISEYKDEKRSQFSRSTCVSEMFCRCRISNHCRIERGRSGSRRK